MKPVSLAEYRNREAIQAHREAIALLEKGVITGSVLVLEYGPEDHRAGVFGSYEKNPASALKATFVLDFQLRGELKPLPGTLRIENESASSCPCRWHVGRK